MNNQDHEILSITQEECSEVAQAVSKCFRFGKDGEWQGKTNRENLEMEIGDVLAMIDILVERSYLSDWSINEARQNKKDKLK